MYGGALAIKPSNNISPYAIKKKISNHESLSCLMNVWIINNLLHIQQSVITTVDLSQHN